MAETELAVIDEESHRATIHIAGISIEINRKPQHDGPLGTADHSGRSPGVIFWKNEYRIGNAKQGFVEFGGGPEITHVEMDEFDVEQILEKLKEKSNGESDTS